MKIHLLRSRRFLLGPIAALLLLATVALAGPPLICHTIEIGQAKSLPWISHNWKLTGTENYDLKNLVPDTLAILDSNTPVLVRMETLRRATLYGEKDSQIAKELLTRLHARATNAESAGRPDALAWFDAGYLTEAYKQLDWKAPNAASGLDGYAMVVKAINLRGNDPEMEFAAALITLDSHQGNHQDHVLKATVGAKTDQLLAQNLASRFIGSDSPTISQMFAKAVTPKQ